MITAIKDKSLKITKSTSLFVLLFVMLTFKLLSQNHNYNSSNLKLSGIIIDSTNNQPLELVKVYNSTKKVGTSSIINGFYNLQNVTPTDSITFYLLGFKKRVLTGAELIISDTIYLIPELKLIDEVVILADNSFLYDIILNCKNNKSSKNLVSKTYLEVKSTNNNEIVELIQGYYNGYFDGYNLSNLVTKNIRLGLQPVNHRLYTSIRTTGIFYEHDLFTPSILFPSNPFQLSKHKLKKDYNLFLNGKFDEDGKTIFVISFEPKEEISSSFTGTVWIDSKEFKIYKIVLKKENAIRHPFDAFWNLKEISNVNLKISKTFTHDNTSTKVNYIDFEYSLDYRIDNTSIPNSIHTHATLQAYNYDDSFIEPYFDFPNEKEWPNHELSKLQVIAYDSLFWNSNNEFNTSNEYWTNNRFYNDEKTITGQMLYNRNLFNFTGSSKQTSLNNLYTHWRENQRIQLRNLGMDTVERKISHGMVPSQLYNLHAQIYLNINKVGDSVYYTTKTIYDPFKTYYYYPRTPETNVFINIYFDIVELQRRKLNLELDKCENNIELMKKAYYKSIHETKEVTKKYLTDVQRGTNQLRLLSWNIAILNQLGIDNIELMRK